MRLVSEQKYSIPKLDWQFVRGLVGLTFLLASLSLSAETESPAGTAQNEGQNVQLGKLDFGAPANPQDGFRSLTGRVTSLASRRDRADLSHKPKAAGQHGDRNTGENDQRQRHETMSTDCFAKRNEVLKRRSLSTTPSPAKPTTAALPSGYQRLRPKTEAGHPAGPVVPSVPNNYDGEHVPRCRLDGSYEPVQCHEIGYCWCVNKYGQAIKNSAFMKGEEPFCDTAMYESDSVDSLVVSAQRMRGLLKPSSGRPDSTTPNGNINFESTEPSTSPDPADGELDAHQQVEAAKRASALEPTFPLIPNDCGTSRKNANERARELVDDSIWVPECDNHDERYYAEWQCHKSRVCWCADKSSGLPLRTSEQLSEQKSAINCTEVRRLHGPTWGAPKAPSSQPAFYQGSSKFCSTEERVEFVAALTNQFRHQIREFLRQNPDAEVPSDLSTGVSPPDPFTISESQVSKWKFRIIDKDLDGKIDDREWSRFSNNFRTVDKSEELEKDHSKIYKIQHQTLSPVLVIRSQAKCWRDFLKFCGGGALLVDESISLSEWLSCTEPPPKSYYDGRYKRRQGGVGTKENIYAHTREAAIARSMGENPLKKFLKPY